MAQEGFDVVVEGEKVLTRGLGAIGRPELMMRMTSPSEEDAARRVLLRLVGFAVGCKAWMIPGDTFSVDDDEEVTLEAAGPDLLEVVRHERRDPST